MSYLIQKTTSDHDFNTFLILFTTPDNSKLYHDSEVIFYNVLLCKGGH